jgi:hypothetical protein
MSQLIPITIMPAPGVVKTESLRAAEGRFIETDKTRVVKGRRQKIGGNVRLTVTPMSGTPRATHCWRDFLQNQYVTCGTYRKLYAFDSSYAPNDITPVSSTGTLGSNPFTTVSGSNVVTVHHVGHGRSVGDAVILAGASAFNNVTLNGTFLVNTTIDANDYTLIATTTANASGSGGGAAVTYQYEIQVGTELGAFGQGWGVGPWGLDTWGTARAASTIFTEPRVWSLDHFGVVLLATYNGGTLWAFDPTQSQPWPRAVGTFGGVAMNAPTDFRAMFVTPERYVFGLCDAMVLKVCSQNDPTTWTPATANTAFQRTLQEGTKLVGGRMLAPFISLVWSDAALFLAQYTGSQFVYNTSLVGKDCGLIGPNAAVTVNGIAFWMGTTNFFFYNGSVQPLPNAEDIRKFIFDAVPANLAFQCAAVYVPRFNEIWFFYPTTGDTNPTKYVIYHINDQCFSEGNSDFYSSVGVTAGRASGDHFTQGDTSPIMAGTDGHLYNHDPIDDTNNDNGNPLTWTLTVAPYALQEGERNLDLEGIVFDFQGQIGDITVQVDGYNRLTDSSGPMDTETETIPAADAGITDFRVSGRYLGMTLSSSEAGNYMRWGKPVAWARPSAMRR